MIALGRHLTLAKWNKNVNESIQTTAKVSSD